MAAGIAARKELRRGGPKLFAPGACIDRRLDMEQAREDACGVGFDDRHRLVEGERGHGIGGVPADSRQMPNQFHISRKRAAMFFNDGDGGGAEISGAGVVAKALPGVEHVVFGGGGERGEVREAPEPLIIIRDNGGDLGLLEHEFGDEDGVGIGGAAPGESAGVFPVPGKERTPKRRSGIRIHVIEENVERPTPNVQRRIWSL